MKSDNRMANGRIFFILQLMNILFSLDTVLIKIASEYWKKDGLISLNTIAYMAIAIFILAIYAVCWQKVLTRVDLTVAYMCKGMIVFWGMLWSFCIFKETISIWNIIGCGIIFSGTILVSIYE